MAQNRGRDDAAELRLCSLMVPALPGQRSSVPPRVGSQDALIDLDLFVCFVCCCGRDGVEDVVHEVWCCAAARGAASKIVAAGRDGKKRCASFRRSRY